MTSLLTVTLGTLVDKALEELQAPSELGKLVVLPGAIDDNDTTFVLTGYTVSISDILEIGNELMLVTGKSADADPIYTVARGYYGTTAAAHSAGAIGYVNPQFNRQRVANAVKRSFARLEALGLPLFTSAVFTPNDADEEELRLVLTMPAGTRDVWSVKADLSEIEGWEFITDLPTASYATGCVVRLPRWVIDTEDTEFNVTYHLPYRWSTHPSAPVEASTIQIPEGAEDLPAAYAAAWLVEAREVSRQELDRAMEWNTNEPTRGGVSMTLLRNKWQSFYRMLDEARRLDAPVPRRPLHRRSTSYSRWA